MRSQEIDVEMDSKYSDKATFQVEKTNAPVSCPDHLDVDMMTQLGPSSHGGSTIPSEGTMNLKQDKLVHSVCYASPEIKASDEKKMIFIETTSPLSSPIRSISVYPKENSPSSFNN